VENVERGPGTVGHRVGGRRHLSLTTLGFRKIETLSVEDENRGSGRSLRHHDVAGCSVDRVMAGTRCGLVMRVRGARLSRSRQDTMIADESQQDQRQQ
jgi:hypothetical protein